MNKEETSKQRTNNKSSTYHMKEILEETTETNTVPINGTVSVHIIFYILHAQARTDSTHDCSRRLTHTPKSCSTNPTTSLTIIKTATYMHISEGF